MRVDSFEASLAYVVFRLALWRVALRLLLSSPEPETPEACVDAPIQSHANVDLVAFSQLNSDSVAKLRQKRDRLQLGGLTSRRALLRQLDRSVWPAVAVAVYDLTLTATRPFARGSLSRERVVAFFYLYFSY